GAVHRWVPARHPGRADFRWSKARRILQPACDRLSENCAEPSGGTTRVPATGATSPAEAIGARRRGFALRMGSESSVARAPVRWYDLQPLRSHGNDGRRTRARSRHGGDSHAPAWPSTRQRPDISARLTPPARAVRSAWRVVCWWCECRARLSQSRVTDRGTIRPRYFLSDAGRAPLPHGRLRALFAGWHARVFGSPRSSGKNSRLPR